MLKSRRSLAFHVTVAMARACRENLTQVCSISVARNVMPASFAILPEADTDDDDAYNGTDCSYEWRSLKAPTLKGILLRIVVWITRSPLWGPFYSHFARRSGVFKALRETSVPEGALYRAPADPEYCFADANLCKKLTGADPLLLEGAKDRFAALQDCIGDGSSDPLAPGPTIRDYHEAYRVGKTDPYSVALYILRFLLANNAKGEKKGPFYGDVSLGNVPGAQSDETDLAEASSMCLDLHWMVGVLVKNTLDQARESQKRWKEGKPLSLLDGVPFAAKDNTVVSGFPARFGTILNKPVEQHDGPAVKALKAAGAILIGVTNMPELGMSPVGLNQHYGSARNPWHFSHLCGGSSSGSAGIVAAGVVPFALGNDSGGSIRVPASCCGVVGLFPTHSRIPPQTGSKYFKTTVMADGPIAGTALDAAVVYACMARRTGDSPGGEDCRYGPSADLGCSTPGVPLYLPRFQGASKGGLKGLRVGVYRDWFNDAERSIVERATEALDKMKEHGVEIVEISIPDLELLRVAHTITLSSDALQDFSRKHIANYREAYGKLSDDLKFSFASASKFSSKDYVSAARIRGRMATHCRAVFARCDVLATPTLPIAPPRLADEGCVSHMAVVGQCMKYVQLGNFMSLPAVSVPCGLDASNLPVGLQLYGPAWHEASLLALAHVLQAEFNASFGRRLSERKLIVHPIKESVRVGR